MKLNKFENLLFNKLKSHFCLDISNANYPNYLTSELSYPKNEYLVVWQNWIAYLNSEGIVTDKMPSSTKFRSEKDGNVYSYRKTDYYRIVIHRPTVRFKKENKEFVCLFECDTSGNRKGFVPVEFVNKSLILGFLP